MLLAPRAVSHAQNQPETSQAHAISILRSRACPPNDKVVRPCFSSMQAVWPMTTKSSSRSSVILWLGEHDQRLVCLHWSGAGHNGFPIMASS